MDSCFLKVGERFLILDHGTENLAGRHLENAAGIGNVLGPGNGKTEAAAKSVHPRQRRTKLPGITTRKKKVTFATQAAVSEVISS